METNLTQYLEPGVYIDSDHETVREFAARASTGTRSERDRAIAAYLAVRDEIRYDPYATSAEPTAYKASSIIARGRGFCVPKAIALAAVCRALGVSARLGFADVRNHMTSPALREAMQTDIFAFHGYAEIYLSGRWVKATPAFNRSLCEKVGVAVLEFDGVEDAVFQAADLSGHRFMEYLHDHGTYADFPLDAMVASWKVHYPHFFSVQGPQAVNMPEREGEFEDEAEVG